jgi:hypothetical protein
MAGSQKVLDSAAAIVASRTVAIDQYGAHRAAAFEVFVTAITRTTGTLTVSLYWSADGTAANGAKIAEVTGLTAAGLANLPLITPFTSTNFAIPSPNLVVWTLVGDATAVTGNVVAFYGD